MTSRSSHEAVGALIASLQRMLSAVTLDNQLVSDGPRNRPLGAIFAPGRRLIRLHGPRQLLLSVQYHYRLLELETPSRGRWDTGTAGYAYTLFDADDRELLAYHLHRYTRAVPGPHLHLGAAAGVGFAPLMTAHFPTGPVSLADVLLFAIRDLGVEPLRDDWTALLEPDV